MRAAPLLLLSVLFGCAPLQRTPHELPPERPRLLVLTDIGGDPDDRQSLIRLLLYANEIEIEALIASASGTPGELDSAVVQPHLIREIVDAYGEVRDNLALHAPGYPTAGELHARIHRGNPQRGRDQVGEGRDTEGSRAIIAAADRADPRPLDISIWGGQTDLAQALWRVRTERGETGLRDFIDRIRVYDIADQDGIADWIRGEFPGIFYILNRAPDGADRREAAFRGMYLGGDESLTSREWLNEHVRQGHGALGALYPWATWTAPNPHNGLKEGDTPAWFYFLPFGPGDPAHPEWGGWGGRLVSAGERLYRDAKDSVEGVTDARATVWRWRPAFQADLQARMDWAVSSVADANHPPVVRVEGAASRMASGGEEVRLDASGSRDPDGDRLSYRWSVYPDAGSHRGEVRIEGSGGRVAVVRIPRVGRPETIHLLLEVTDDGLPRLTRYARVVLEVRP